jgi:hypothetical protein
MIPTLANVVRHLAPMLSATVEVHADSFVLSSAIFRRSILMEEAVFVQAADKLTEIASDVFPHIEAELAVAMLLANFLDAVDATEALGLSLTLSREGFVVQPVAD